MREAFGAEFAVPDGYLNTPSIGVPPAHVADAVVESVQRWRRAADNADDFEDVVDASRAGFARLVGVPTEWVAIGTTVAQLVALAAAGVPDGGRVLLARGDFTSVGYPFAAQARRGITTTEVPLAELPERVAGHDLVAVSVAQSADGALVDLAALRAAAEAAGVPVLLDATQAAGWLPLRLDWADWVVAAAYKWLLSPRGAAWLAVRPRAAERSVPVAANWYAGEDPWGRSAYGLPMRLASGARGLAASPVWLAHVGAAAALPYLADLDLEEVRRHDVGLANRLRAGLGLPPGDSAIVAVEADRAAERLAAAGVRASVRNGRARVGFHLYNTTDDVDRALEALARPS
ncbi:Selenocysteine lyase/Cysteine desulfurase [Amycolatopsis arida]|uniref:Selenocysteine lyase/Cysteine desulfurase n=1 Tax=Amycolatopsis arida TaxID=587909 RepID=A0A1I5VE31_9PSEU|nr:aminotransferase class V-fold PLP-dependent enzyme [Amycolatopsis arida]TDX91231.1 selenocysteine lyase/cysteine desulfurase [Amycolatopsis arida]SFQ05246.1 Selenocysteine lyase/Cysteine desulfurase [Amycolatopsis arida]